MELVLWRVEALAPPAWHAVCARCDRVTPHLTTHRFRVNAHGRRHDVWLLYRCGTCEATRKRRLARARDLRDLGAERLAAYLANDPDAAWRHAFEVEVREPLPHRVRRPALPPVGAFAARIVQPHPCGVRWDRLLAAELGWSRERTKRAWRAGAACVSGVRRPSEVVRDGQVLRLALEPPAAAPEARPGACGPDDPSSDAARARAPPGALRAPALGEVPSPGHPLAAIRAPRPPRGPRCRPSSRPRSCSCSPISS